MCNPDHLFASIKALAEQQQALAAQALQIYTPMVESLIASKTTHNPEIERTLELLLDFAFDENILLLYKKLCRYYWNINPQATAAYVQYYREMWEEETD